MSQKRKFKVLTLDGGGVRGYLTAKILTNIEVLLNTARNENINIGQRFDLVVGTSTGGIIASALSIGKSAKYILEIYEKLIPKVFNPIYQGIVSPKYSNEILRKELFDVFGDNKLSDVITDLCLTSVDVENSSPRFHKSDYFKRNIPRIDETLVDICLATSAAPTYFPLVDTKHSHNLTDGGVVANNPSLVGYIEASQIIKEKNEEFEGISLISIGTGEQCHMPYDIDNLRNAGKIDWIINLDKDTKVSKLKDDIKNGNNKIDMIMNLCFSNKIKPDIHGSPLLELLMDSQSKLAHYQTSFLLGSDYFRINPKLSLKIELDSADKIHNLKNLADINKFDFDKIDKLI
jgi:uncharacterized protein